MPDVVQTPVSPVTSQRPASAPGPISPSGALDGAARSSAPPRMSQDPRPVARILVDAVLGAEPASYPWDQVDADQLLRASLSHGVTPALAVHLRARDDVPPALAARLQGCYRDQLARHLRTLADLRRVAATLNGAGLAWAVVKGPHLAECLWPRPDLRLYVDLDVVIDRHSLADAITLLTAAGARPVDRNWPFILERMQGELSMTLPFGTPLDLHWHLVNDRQLRRVFSFPMEELLDRARPRSLGGVEAPVLDEVDTVLHLAYHMVHSGGHRLVWLKDFDLALRAVGPDASELLERARRYGCELPLAVSIQRTTRLLGGSEDHPAVHWRGGLWGRLASAADRWRPVPQLPGERRSGRIVFQSTRGGQAASARAAVRAAVDRSWNEEGTAGAINPLHLDIDDPTARERFFSLVGGAVQP